MMRAEVVDLIEENGAIAGVVAKTPWRDEGPRESYYRRGRAPFRGA